MRSDHFRSKSIAVLARLRRGIGKRPGEIPELWEWMMTDEQLRFSEPTYEEWASYIALTLYAFHQQGNDIKQHQMNTDKRFCSGNVFAFRRR